MDLEYVRRLGKSTVISLLNISIDPNYPIFQIETGEVVNGVGKAVSGAAYEPQRLVVSGSALLAIYELIEPHVDSLRSIEEEMSSAHPVK